MSPKRSPTRSRVSRDVAAWSGSRGRRVRVLHVITWLDRGGAQDHLRCLLAGLDHSDFDLTVASGTSDGSRGDLFPPLAEAERVIPLRHLRREVAPFHDVLAISELGRLVDRLQPDIVHTHSSKAGVVGRLAAASRSVRTVHNVHGWSFRATANPVLRWAAIELERRLAERTDVMLNVAEADRLLGEGLGIRARVSTEVVRGGIDLERFRPSGRPRREFDDEQPVVGTVGRLSPQKDPITALRAMRLVVDRHPNARFRWIGDGPMRSEIEEAVRALGLGGKVELAGARSDIPSELATLDVFVLSSRFEGLPRSLMEASAAGVPIVATRVDGVEEIVRDRVTGLVVDPGDPEALAAAISETIAERGVAEQRARAALDAASAYSTAVMCARTADVYRSLVA